MAHPDVVDRHPRRQRILRVGDPARQRQPPAGAGRRDRPGRAGCTRTSSFARAPASRRRRRLRGPGRVWSSASATAFAPASSGLALSGGLARRCERHSARRRASSALRATRPWRSAVAASRADARSAVRASASGRRSAASARRRPVGLRPPSSPPVATAASAFAGAAGAAGAAFVGLRRPLGLASRRLGLAGGDRLVPDELPAGRGEWLGRAGPPARSNRPCPAEDARARRASAAGPCRAPSRRRG